LIKVLLVDDHKIVRAGIRHIVESASDMEVIGEASTGEEALSFVRETPPHVLLMDLQMPGIGGLETTRKILRVNSKVRILVLTVCDDDIFPMRLLKSGALGYLTKGCASNELLHAIRQVYEGKKCLSSAVAQQLALKRFDDSVSPFDALSERELQVMLMITRGKKVAFIAEKLHLSPKTVNTYRYRLFAKLQVNSDVELTHLAIRYGIVENHSVDEKE